MNQKFYWNSSIWNVIWILEAKKVLVIWLIKIYRCQNVHNCEIIYTKLHCQVYLSVSRELICANQSPSHSRGFLCISLCGFLTYTNEIQKLN